MTVRLKGGTMAEPEKDGAVGDAAAPDARENAEGAATGSEL